MCTATPASPLPPGHNTSWLQQSCSVATLARTMTDAGFSGATVERPRIAHFGGATHVALMMSHAVPCEQHVPTASLTQPTLLQQKDEAGSQHVEPQ